MDNSNSSIKAWIISSDDIKKEIKGYNPEKANKFHKESSKLADKEYERAIISSKYKDVIIMNGGSASGKTEFIMTQLANSKSIIYDGTSSSKEGLRIKERFARKNKKKIQIIALIPLNLRDAFTAFTNRDRQFPDKYFYFTHSRSRATLLWAIQNLENVTYRKILSYYKNNTLNFREFIYNDRKELINYLKMIQKIEDGIIKLVLRKL